VCTSFTVLWPCSCECAWEPLLLPIAIDRSKNRGSTRKHGYCPVQHHSWHNGNSFNLPMKQSPEQSGVPIGDGFGLSALMWIPDICGELMECKDRNEVRWHKSGHGRQQQFRTRSSMQVPPLNDIASLWPFERLCSWMMLGIFKHWQDKRQLSRRKVDGKCSICDQGLHSKVTT